MRKSLPMFALALILVTLSTAAMADNAPVVAATAAAGVININPADAAQLALLPRVGEKAAQRIIAYRTEHGPFKTTSDLMQVKGVGAKTFELMSPYLAVDGKTTLATKVSSPRKQRAARN